MIRERCSEEKIIFWTCIIILVVGFFAVYKGY